jgi:hypothetical protein
MIQKRKENYFMAKKFGKIAILGVIATAAAGTYYYFQNKTTKPAEDLDDLDDFDDFDEDLDDDDFSSENSTSNSGKSHSHVSIDIDNAKEKIGEKVIETLDKTKEKLEQFNVSEKIDKAKEFIGEITTPASEPVYTEMDMNASDASSEKTDEANDDEASSSVSSTYADSANANKEDITEKFLDD